MTSDSSGSIPREAFDFVVIGGGLAGCSAALRASDLGLKTALIDMREAGVGGAFVHDLSVPIAIMRRSAFVLRTARHAGEYAIELAEEARVDMSGLQRRKQILIAQFEKNMRTSLENRRVSVFKGRGFLMAANSVAVLDPETGDETALLESGSIVLATGSAARVDAPVKVDGTGILLPEQLLRQRRSVRSLVLLGGGTVACELASIYREFGVEVTLVAGSDGILPWADGEIVEVLKSGLEKRGVRLQLDSEVASVDFSGSECRTLIRQGGEEAALVSELVIAAAPREPSTRDLGLIKLGIGLVEGEGRIVVDESCRTSCPGVYAIGSCASGDGSTSAVDRAQGWFVAGHAAGQSPRVPDLCRLPRTVETDPPVAVIGMTESEAHACGSTVAVGRSEFKELSQSVLCGESTGLVKVVTDAETGEILGAHIIGPMAGDLVAQFQLAGEFEYTAFEFPELLGPVLSVGEAVGESIRSARKSSPGV